MSHLLTWTEFQWGFIVHAEQGLGNEGVGPLVALDLVVLEPQCCFSLWDLPTSKYRFLLLLTDFHHGFSTGPSWTPPNISTLPLLNSFLAFLTFGSLSSEASLARN